MLVLPFPQYDVEYVTKLLAAFNSESHPECYSLTIILCKQIIHGELHLCYCRMSCRTNTKRSYQSRQDAMTYSRLFYEISHTSSYTKLFLLRYAIRRLRILDFTEIYQMVSSLYQQVYLRRRCRALASPGIILRIDLLNA